MAYVLHWKVAEFLKWNMKKLSLILLAFFVYNHTSFANDQNLIIGVGVTGLEALGKAKLNNPDDIRGEDPLLGYAELYINYFPGTDFGISLIRSTLGTKREYYSYSFSCSGGSCTTTDITTKEEVVIRNTLACINYVFWGSSNYTRTGLLFGVGKTEYLYSLKQDGTMNSTDYSNLNNFNSVSDASIVGLYIDWGGDSFGARFGFKTINVDGLQSIKVDSSEKNLDGDSTVRNFSLRWAF